MPRSMVQFERNDAGDFVPVGVWFATVQRLQARMLPGSASRDAFMKYVLSDASRPLVPYTNQKGTWSDWIEWAEWSLSDGHIRMMRECVPGLNLDATYSREVLGETTPAPLTDPKQQPTLDVPGLKGYKTREWTAGIGGRPK